MKRASIIPLIVFIVAGFVFHIGIFFLIITGFRPVRLGDHTLRISVASPAAGLAGVEQRLISLYDPCGMEKMPVLTASIFGTAAILVSLIPIRIARFMATCCL